MKLNLETLSGTRANNDKKDLFVKLDKCPACHSTKIDYELSSHDNHYGVSGDYDHFRCRDCNLLFLNPMPSLLFLSDAYPTDYYAYQELSDETHTKSLIKKILGLSYRTMDPIFKKPGVMLDIGCGSGEFLKSMKSQGWDVYGVEPSESAAKIGQKAGLNIFNGTLENSGLNPRTFDYIRSNHSFEHINDPHKTLKVVSQIIKPGGKLFIGVPNTKSFAFKVFKQHWWNLGAPQHPINYDTKSLGKLVTPYGFKIISIRTNSHYSGIVGSCQIRFNNSRGLKKDSGAFLEFTPLKIIGGWISKVLDLFQTGDCLEIVFEKI